MHFRIHWGHYIGNREWFQKLRETLSSWSEISLIPEFVSVAMVTTAHLSPKIDVLQAEVQALKTLVLSSPTSPIGELPSVGGGGVKTPFRKGHSRNKSTSSAILGTQPDPSATQPIVRECREVWETRGCLMFVQSETSQNYFKTNCCHVQVDNQLFTDFKAWKEGPTLDRSCCFLERVYREDIYPCLTFSKSEVHSEEHASSLKMQF